MKKRYVGVYEANKLKHSRAKSAKKKKRNFTIKIIITMIVAIVIGIILGLSLTTIKNVICNYDSNDYSKYPKATTATDTDNQDVITVSANSDTDSIQLISVDDYEESHKGRFIDYSIPENKIIYSKNEITMNLNTANEFINFVDDLNHKALTAETGSVISGMTPIENEKDEECADDYTIVSTSSRYDQIDNDATIRHVSNSTETNTASQANTESYTSSNSSVSESVKEVPVETITETYNSSESTNEVSTSTQQETLEESNATTDVEEETVEDNNVSDESTIDTSNSTMASSINSTKATSSNSGYEHYISDPGNYAFNPSYNADGSINYFGYTYEDFDYLCQVIAGEAGQWSSWKLQMYVGSVVLNRVHHSAFPQSTIKGICLAANQYSCFNKSSGRCYAEVSEKNKAAAYELLRNGSVLPYNVVFQAQFKQGSGTYETVGNQYFCYLDY